MECKVNENLLRSVEEGVPESDFNNLAIIAKYYQTLEDNLIKMQEVCNDQFNKNITDEDYFKKFFKCYTLQYNKEELDSFFKRYFNGNYKIVNLKTNVPITKYLIREGKSIYGLLNISVVTKENKDLDLEKVYTQNEIVNLENQGEIIYLKVLNDYSRNITPGEYRNYVKENNKLFVPLLFNNDDTTLDYVNYFYLICVCPEFFEYLRNKVDNMHILMDNALGEYKIAIGNLINKDTKECDEKIQFYTNARQKIKSFGK